MENNSDQRKFPSSSLKTIFASFSEHSYEGNQQQFRIPSCGAEGIEIEPLISFITFLQSLKIA